MSDDHEPHEIDTALSGAVRGKQVVETSEDCGDWLAERVERDWDDQIERDVHAGRLNLLIDQALEEHRAGQTRPL